MGESGVMKTFTEATSGADIAVIEGAMGMFDGTGGTDTASAAHIARILQAPIILVVDAHAVSRSIHAVIRGFRDFDPRVNIAGIIYNRIGSDRHRTMIEKGAEVPALGWVPRQQEKEVKSRHLGLVMAHETSSMKSFGDIIEKSCDLDQILAAASAAPPLDITPQYSRKIPSSHPRATIGVARDEAFCFYYQDNIDRLVRAGAEIRYFSPMENAKPEMDAVYIGGGYPELHASALARSQFKGYLKKLAAGGMPVYGECGGLMYLTESLETDKKYPMTGILPARVTMTKKLQALGYVKGTFSGKLWPGSVAVRGHEFHYSRVDSDDTARFALHLTKGKGICEGKDGLTEHATIGSYTHAYFSDTFCRNFVSAARAFSRT